MIVVVGNGDAKVMRQPLNSKIYKPEYFSKCSSINKICFLSTNTYQNTFKCVLVSIKKIPEHFLPIGTLLKKEHCKKNIIKKG
jgi:hypothetical protein